MVAEYANRYKHHPAQVPGLSWHEFLGLVKRTGAFDTRDMLVVSDGTAMAEVPATNATGTLMKAKLRDLAALGEKV